MAIDDSDYPGLRIAGEFGAVEQYLLLLSEYLPMVREQTRLRSEMELERKYIQNILELVFLMNMIRLNG